MNKRWSHALLSLCTVSLIAIPQVSLADIAKSGAATTASKTPTAVSLYVDGKKLQLDENPYSSNHHSMVPLRALAEALGAQVSWSADDPSRVMVSKDGNVVTIHVGQAEAMVNAKSYTLDPQPEMKNNHVFVSEGFAVLALGCDFVIDPLAKRLHVIPDVYPIGEDPQSHQELNLTNYTDPKSLDSAGPDITNAHDELLGQVEEGLVRLDAKGQPIPGIAQSWNLAVDGRTYTFTIRDDAKWSDGSSVTAQDFEYAWKRALDPNRPFEDEYMLEAIQGAAAYHNGTGSADQVEVKALDDKTLQVTLAAPMPYFLSEMALTTFLPLKRSFVESMGNQYGTSADTMLYDGPFALQVWMPKNEEVLTRNASYWDKQNVKLDEVRYLLAPNSTLAEQAYQMGLIDRFPVTPDQYDRLKDSSDFQTINNLETAYLHFNAKQPVLQNVNIRKALSDAIDIQQMLAASMHGYTSEATGLVPPGTADGVGGDFRADNGDLLDRKDNAAKAKDLFNTGMSQLGLTSFPKLSLMIEEGTLTAQLAYNLQQQWKQTLGIDVDVQLVPFADRLQREDTGDYDIGFAEWGADYNDPMTFLDLFTSGNANNNVAYHNPQYDTLIAATKSETDAGKRLADMKQAETMLLGDMPVAPLFFRSSAYMLKPYVKGWISHDFGTSYDLKNVYIDGN